MNTSPILTAMDLTLVRSISMNNCGTLERNKRKKSDQARLLVAALDQPVGHALQGLNAVVAAVLDHQLEAPGGPQAVDRRESRKH